jgi:hypothetical protein
VLGGAIVRALPVCSSWEDAAWARLRCWLEAEVDSRVGVEAAASGAGVPAAALLAALPAGADGVAVRGAWPP